MEAVFMALQERLHSSTVIILLATFFGCTTGTTKNPVLISEQLLNKADQPARFENGLLMIGSLPFSGTLYSLYPGTTDTAELSSYHLGRENGEWKKFYPSKKIKEKRYFSNGRKTGEYLAWWENGNRQLQYYFIADEYEGSCTEWNEAGMVSKVMNYKKGHEEGHQQWWYDGGKIKANYIIKDGRRFGLLGTKNCINVSDSVFKN